jgi:nucleoporin GLE1
LSLREALENKLGSSLIDPGVFTLEPRSPVAGATHNEDQLPSLFFYLINIFAKATIKQFIVETSASPETADPIGVTIAIVFSDADFHWRGASMIDILMAKFRIVCPVLFGYRGNEKTEQGRARLGWWKDRNGQWIDEQSHMNRMMGIGSGFAAVALRNFGKSTKQNPYPPRHYWVAMAKIVNTPPAEVSNTQCLVLKAMIENYEQKFIEFYGTAALAALRTALIEFPGKVPQKSPAVNSLEVVATLLKKETGLALG